MFRRFVNMCDVIRIYSITFIFNYTTGHCPTLMKPCQKLSFGYSVNGIVILGASELDSQRMDGILYKIFGLMNM
jgi:hypothetical protein